MATPEEIANEVFAEEAEVEEPVTEVEEAEVEEPVTEVEEAEVEEPVTEVEEEPEVEEPVTEVKEEPEADIFQMPIEMNETNYIDVIHTQIAEMIQYQKGKSLFEDENYLRYSAYLQQYFAKETKKTKVDRSYTPEGYILTSRANKANKIRIVPSIIVDLRQYRQKLQREMDRILFEIVQWMENPLIQDEEYTAFEKHKTQYIAHRKQLQEIDVFETDFQKTCQELEEKIASAVIDLKILSTKRKSAYEVIPGQTVSYELKRKIMDFYKSTGLEIPDASQINRFSKENEIPTEVIEGLLAWLDVSQTYMKKELEHKETVAKLQQEIAQHEAILQFFILQKPRIEKI